MTTTTPPPATHSPLPWRAAYEGEPEIKDANGRCIANVYQLGDDGQPTPAETDANAALIVAACNSHEANKEAVRCLRSLVELIKKMPADMSNPRWCEVVACLCMSDAAIAAAGEQP